MQASKAVEGLKVTGDKNAAADQIKALYKTFTESDCTMVEVSMAAPYSIAALEPHWSIEVCPAMPVHILIITLTTKCCNISVEQFFNTSLWESKNRRTTK